MAMDTQVTVALITGGFAFAGTFCGVIFSQRKTAALVDYRVKELEKKVDKHNNLVERMYCVEQKIALHEQKIEDLDERRD